MAETETTDAGRKTPRPRTSRRKPTNQLPAVPAEADDEFPGFAKMRPFRAGAIEYGEQLAKRIEGRYRYAPGLGWKRYNGAYWEEATEEELIPDVREMIAEYAPVVLKRDGADGAKALVGASSGSGIAGMLKVAKGLPGILARDQDFDRPRSPGCPDDPHLFPCANGKTIELYDSGEWSVRESRPEDLMTRAGCAYDPEATATYTGKMFTLYQPDAEVRAFLLRIMVGALRGVQLQHLFVWFGELAGNGKGTMQAVFSEVMGGYARTIPVQALMRSHSSNEYRDEIASLKGSRLVFADEPEEGSRFAPGFVSRLTGGSEISARGMYQKSMSFVPTWTLVMPTNKRPAWGDHSGLNRRYNEVAWNYFIPRDEMSEGVKDRMRAEASGVLNQLLCWWGNFCERGIAVPAVVQAQTEEGKAQSDPISRFLADCTQPEANTRVSVAAMYNSYKEWSDQQNERARTGTAFSQALKSKGITHIRSNGSYWEGLTVSTSGF